jgi:lipopolysaccharide transport system ATP-binding protein
MTDVAIRGEGLAKQYRIGERETYSTLRDAITHAFTSPRRLLSSAARHSSNGREDLIFWALKDVSFEIKRGEVLGIIGRNGAGKSTLLKILSRITEPTRGHVDIWGRVGSLLEVGTGFHPELTGRDNIFLNGAVLGMRRTEIARKFDEIVAFAEVERFIDTPVKRYSSGMYVRLAFAVAAHLEPEILIVDEVLAVGDAHFQQKCLGKMQDVSKSGRTVVFVSHQIASVQRLCTRGILLQKGTIEISSDINAVLDRYLAGSKVNADGDRQIEVSRGECRIMSWSIVRDYDSPDHSCVSRQSVTFRLRIESKRTIPYAQLGFVIRNLVGDLLLSANSRDDFQKPFGIPEGLTEIQVTARLPLRMGRYRLELAIEDENFQVIDHWIAEPLLSILPCNNSVLPVEWQGLVNEPVSFEICK